MRLLSFFSPALALLLAALFSSASFAATDYSSLTASVDFSAVISAVLIVAAALAGVYIALKGAKLILVSLRSN